MSQVTWHHAGLHFTAEVFEEDWGEEGKNYEVESIEATLDVETSDDADLQRACEWWGFDLTKDDLSSLVEDNWSMLQTEAIERYLKENR